MRRLIEKTVFSGLVTACRFATWPTRRSPLLVIATTEGVRREPSLFSRTVGSPPSMTAITELVVPRSMPITFAIASRFLPFRAACEEPPYLTNDRFLLTLTSFRLNPPHLPFHCRSARRRDVKVLFLRPGEHHISLWECLHAVPAPRSRE